MKAKHKPEQIKFRGTLPVRTNPFTFAGPVNEAGYEWRKGRDGKPHLVPCRVPGFGLRPCEPHPGLFREFAEIKPVKDSIQAFAGKYGDLYSEYGPQQSAQREDGSVTFGASLGTWTQEIGDMRVLVNLWDHINVQDFEALEKIVQRTDKEIGYVIETPKRKSNVTLAHADIPGSRFDRFDSDDVLSPARCALQMEVNKRIAEHSTIPRLTWTPVTPPKVEPVILQRIIFESSNLLAAMWMQFAQAITGDLRLVKCVSCGKYFQVGPGAKRADTTTCSAACRQWKRRNL